MKRIPAIAALFLSVPLVAQQPPRVPSTVPIQTAPALGRIDQKQTAKPNTPPVITDAQRAQFFKAQSLMIQANAQAQQKQTEFQAAIAEMQKTCGDTATLQSNPNGDPECVAKPAPAETPEPTKGTK